MREAISSPTHVHKAIYFTKPGFYTIDYYISMRPKGAQYDVYSDFTMYYLVGDKTISAAHKAMNDNGDNNDSTMIIKVFCSGTWTRLDC